MNLIPPPAKRTWTGGCFFNVFIFFWCFITFVADFFLIGSIAMQIGSKTFAETTGTIAHSAVKAESDGEGGTSYSLEVKYTYAVNGQFHTGDRYRFASSGFGRKALRKLQSELPVGKIVPVRYFERAPEYAVLDTDLHGIDLFMPWFFVPFNVIAIGGLVYAFRGERPRFVPGDPRVIAFTATGWQFRPGGRDWWFYFGSTLLLITFCGIFLIGFTIGFNPPIWLMNAVWSATITVSCWIASRYRNYAVLEVDEFQKTITIASQKAPSTVPLAEVAGFTVEEEANIDSEGDRTTWYHVALQWGEPKQTIRFQRYADRDTAHAVANWLTTAIGNTFRQT